MKKLGYFTKITISYVILVVALVTLGFLMTGCAGDNKYYNNPTYNCNLTYDQDVENSVIVIKHGKPHKVVTVNGICLMPNGTNTVTIQ